MKNKQKTVGWKFKDGLFSICYLGPFLIFFTLFTVLPVVISMFLSFTNYNVFETPKFIGFQNYMELLFSDDTFLIALKNTLVIALISGPVGYLASLLVAWFINDLNPKIRPLMVLFFYAPSISGGAYMIWQIMFSGDAYGYANSILMYLNIIDEPIQWLTDAKYMLGLVIAVQIWMSLGSGFLSFVAGLRGIDRSYYEVGYVEGIRNRWQELRYITLPSMSHMLLFSAVMQIQSSFSISAVAVELAGYPSVQYSVDTIVTHMSDMATVRYELGYASAIAVVLFAMMAFTRLIIGKALNTVSR